MRLLTEQDPQRRPSQPRRRSPFSAAQGDSGDTDVRVWAYERRLEAARSDWARNALAASRRVSARSAPGAPGSEDAVQDSSPAEQVRVRGTRRLDCEAGRDLLARWQPYAGVVYLCLLLDSLSEDGVITAELAT